MKVSEINMQGYNTDRNDMNVAQLRELAAELDIAGRSKMRRAELLNAIAFAEQDVPVPTSDIHDHAAAVALMRANREAEEEERAAARRARNRTNYAPATESAEHADAEAGELLDAVLGEYVEPTADTGKIAITKYSGHEAFGTAVFEGRSIGGHATRERGRWVLRVEMGRTIRAKTLGKVARQWAKSLGFYAATIDVETMS